MWKTLAVWLPTIPSTSLDPESRLRIKRITPINRNAEQFFNKQLLFKRYSPSEQHGCATGGSFHVVASILAGAETPTNQLTAPEGSFKRDCQRAEAQAAVIEQWAKTTGCWVVFRKTSNPQLLGLSAFFACKARNNHLDAHVLVQQKRLRH